MHDSSLAQLQKFSKSIKDDVYKSLDVENSIKSRDGIGETSPKSVNAQAHKNLKRLKELGYKEWGSCHIFSYLFYWQTMSNLKKCQL